MNETTPTTPAATTPAPKSTQQTVVKILTHPVTRFFYGVILGGLIVGAIFLHQLSASDGAINKLQQQVNGLGQSVAQATALAAENKSNYDRANSELQASIAAGSRSAADNKRLQGQLSTATTALATSKQQIDSLRAAAKADADAIAKLSGAAGDLADTVGQLTSGFSSGSSQLDAIAERLGQLQQLLGKGLDFANGLASAESAAN